MPFASASKEFDPSGPIVVGLLFVAAAVVAYVSQRRRVAAFRGAAKAIGAEIVQVKSDQFTARARGYALTFRLSSGGKSTPARTHVEIGTRPFELVLGLTKQAEWVPRAHVDRVDLEVGDAAFDAAWTVEGAPAARVRRLLSDARLRARLTDTALLGKVDIQVDGGALRLTRDGQDYQGGVVSIENVEHMLDLADAVMAECALPSPGAPEAEADYRHAAGAKVDDGGADHAEILDLKRQRAARAVAKMRPILFVMPVFIVGGMNALFALSHKHWPAIARAFPLYALAVFLVGMRTVWTKYVADRREAGLPFDYAPFVCLAAAASVAVAGCLGWFGY